MKGNFKCLTILLFYGAVVSLKCFRVANRHAAACRFIRSDESIQLRLECRTVSGAILIAKHAAR